MATKGHLRLVEDSAAASSATTPEPAIAAAEAPPSSRGARGIESLPDEALVTLGIEGDNYALELLYRRHASFAIHLATRIEGSTHDVEDVVHDAYVKAFERLETLTDRSAFRSWLGAIVVHRVRSRMRRTRLMNVLGLGRTDPIDLDTLTSSDASPHARAQVAQVYALLRTLKTDERIAWTLRSVEGHDLETVAKLTDCSLATVKRRISRAQKFLNEHFVHSDVEERDAEERNSEESDPEGRDSLVHSLDESHKDHPSADQRGTARRVRKEKKAK